MGVQTDKQGKQARMIDVVIELRYINMSSCVASYKNKWLWIEIFIYICLCTDYLNTYINISLFCQLRRPRNNDTLVVLRCQFLTLFFNHMKQGSLEKWLILGLEQEMYKMSLGYLIVAESKEVPPAPWHAGIHTHTDKNGYVLKGHWSQRKDLLMAKTGTI